jgi:transcriptional regulator with XRE-family HTH domain
MERMKISITVDIPDLEDILRDARNSLKLSQNDLAHQIRLLGMKTTAQNIQKIESGETKTLPYETLQKLCEGLGLDLDEHLREACQAQVPFLKTEEKTIDEDS